MNIVALHISGHGSEVWLEYLMRIRRSSGRHNVTLLLNTDDNGGFTGYQRRHIEFLRILDEFNILTSIKSFSNNSNDTDRSFQAINLPVGDLRSFLTMFLKYEMESASQSDEIIKLRQTDLLNTLQKSIFYNKTSGNKNSELRQNTRDATIKEIARDIDLGLNLILRESFGGSIFSPAKIRLYINSFLDFLETESGEVYEIKIGNMILKYLMIFCGGASEQFFELINIIPKGIKVKYLFDYPVDCAGEVLAGSEYQLHHGKNLIIGESSIDTHPTPVANLHYIYPGVVPDEDSTWAHYAINSLDPETSKLISGADFLLSGAGSIANQQPVLRLVVPHINPNAMVIKILNLFQTPNEVGLEQFVDWIESQKLPNLRILGSSQDIEPFLNMPSGNGETTWKEAYKNEGKAPIASLELKKIEKKYPRIVKLCLRLQLNERVGGQIIGLKYDIVRLSELVESILKERREDRETEIVKPDERSGGHLGYCKIF